MESPRKGKYTRRLLGVRERERGTSKLGVRERKEGREFAPSKAQVIVVVVGVWKIYVFSFSLFLQSGLREQSNDISKAVDTSISICNC